MKNLTNRIQELNQMQIISFDAETNGLWGRAFSIAAIVYDPQGMEIDRFLGRCPIQEEVNSWVSENVLPNMQDIEETHKSYEEMLKAFFQFAQKPVDSIYIILTYPAKNHNLKRAKES